jgi:hypothetical protein
MKFYSIAVLVMTLFSSCLKQSIPDAMLASRNPDGKGSTTATLSYKINGNAVNISVDDADNQSLYPYYTLGCSKNQGYYNLDGVSNTGEITFSFYTDSLTVGNYKYTAGEIFVTDYNNTNEFVYAPSDSMSINITSYQNGHISGNFSGVLTPMIAAGNPYNTYGTPSSVPITNGSFKNVPVFY